MNLLKSRNKGETLQIITFGRFMVVYGETVLSEKAGRAQKSWELLKYLLTNRDKRLSPEVITETLWPDQEYADLRGSMRVQVHRIRQFLAEHFPPPFPLEISFSQGYYALKLEDCRLDTEDFEDISRRAYELAGCDPAEAIALYNRAVDLYKGDYLAEVNSGWVLPLRSYYRRLYLKNVLALTWLLKKAGRHGELTDLLEQAFLVEPYEEELHLHYLEALLKLNKTAQARAHYEYITLILYQEMGARPSPSLRQVYNAIKRVEEHLCPDLADLGQFLGNGDEGKGALCCEAEIFQFIYNLELRRAERSDSPVHVAVVTLTTDGLAPAGDERRLTEQLEKTLLANLRRCDVVCRLGEGRFALLLPGMHFNQVQTALQRIKDKYKREFRLKGAKLHSSMLPYLPGA